MGDLEDALWFVFGCAIIGMAAIIFGVGFGLGAWLF